MLYKLIQRGVPGWFPFHSLHVMQPMYTRKTNEQIARDIGDVTDSRIKVERAPKAFFDKVKLVLPRQDGDQTKPKEGSLRWYESYVACELLSAGKTVKEVSEIMWMTALGCIAVVDWLFPW